MKRLALIVLVLAGCKPLVKSSDGRIATPAPPGRWEWNEEKRGGEGWSLIEIKWRADDGRGLLAKEYVAQAEPLEAVCARDWREHYKDLFSRMSSVDAKIVPRSGGACAVSIRALPDDNGGTMQLRELHMPRGDRLLLLTAIGEDVVDKPAIADEWMAGVKFKALGDAF